VVTNDREVSLMATKKEISNSGCNHISFVCGFVYTLYLFHTDYSLFSPRHTLSIQNSVLLFFSITEDCTWNECSPEISANQQIAPIHSAIYETIRTIFGWEVAQQELGKGKGSGRIGDGAAQEKY
jgi:hypothetical protein